MAEINWDKMGLLGRMRLVMFGNGLAGVRALRAVR